MVSLLVVFFVWRMFRPLNIFVVSDEFALPMDMVVPAGLETLLASECGLCHSEIYEEWRDSMHANAWSDPYYQVDFVFDGSQQICLNCHVPLQDQQENLVLGFKDKDRFKPILEPNPDFNPELQQEGVTCAVCHIRDGIILGPNSITGAPHPIRQDKSMTNGVGVCRKCHVVSGDRWDTFYRIPPCGTVAELKESEHSGAINCVGCHMPTIQRSSLVGSLPRKGRMHIWRGGHDREMVRSALKVDFNIIQKTESRGEIKLSLTNTGADHYLPTGTPDRHLTVEFIIKSKNGDILKSKTYKLSRKIMWRPFIIDLWDTRLIKNKPRIFNFSWGRTHSEEEASLEIVVSYHLLDEARRKRIGYQNTEPISFKLFQKKHILSQKR